MAIQIDDFLAYLDRGNAGSDFSMFLNSLADDKNYPTITKNKERIIVDEQIYMHFNERLNNKKDKCFSFVNIVFNKEVIFTGDTNGGLCFDFTNTYFKKLSIYNCKIDSIIFNGKINHIEELNISNCKIDKITLDSNIKGNIVFKECKFDDFNAHSSGDHIDCISNFIFEFCEVNMIANFKNFKFNNKVSFNMSKFKNNIYFNNSIFDDYVDFHECEFEKTAYFYGVTFYKAPNFSQAIFRENISFVNAKFEFLFETLNKQIEQEFQNFNMDVKKAEKPLEKFANDFRDSFRLIKNALIKENDLLEASNFHKYELYCKEIELKQNLTNRGKNVKNENNIDVIKRNTKKFKEYIDCLLLGFYRKLCDHHTDFLKVCNNLILLIALYALFVFCITFLHDDNIYNDSAKDIRNLSKFLDIFKCCFYIGAVLCAVFSIYVLFKYNFIKDFINKFKPFKFRCHGWKRLLKRIDKKLVNCRMDLKMMIKDLWYLVESVLFALLFSYMIFLLLMGFFGKFLGWYIGYSTIINVFFVSLYASLVYTKSILFGRYMILMISYIGFFILLVKYPTIIHPLIGKITSEFDETLNYPSLMTLNILYTMLIFLVLFSLQKTARKNSIVPH